MNTPHPVQTLAQRKAIAAYTSAQRGADAAREAQTELERLLAAKKAKEDARAARYLASREGVARHAERVSFERRHSAPAPAPKADAWAWVNRVTLSLGLTALAWMLGEVARSWGAK